jgi:hypothetical protein
MLNMAFTEKYQPGANSFLIKLMQQFDAQRSS